MKRLFFIILISLFAPFTLADKTEPTNAMPYWELKKQDGTLVRSTDFLGKPVIIHFWATWCPYCKKLQPGLDRIAKEFQAEGLQMIAISFSEDQDAQPQTHLSQRGLDIQTLVNGDTVAKELFSVVGTPTTFFVSAEGEILGSTMQSDPNDPQWEEIVQYLTQPLVKDQVN